MIPVLTGLGLAGAAGLNAWVVLLLFNGLARLLPQDFPGPVTAFLTSPAVLQVSLVLFLAEFIVTKIPLADRFWEAAQTLLRPVVGALLVLAAIPESAGLLPRIALALAGAAATLGAHVAKSTTRLTSTAATRGGMQLILSLVEDIIALVLATLVFFQPIFTIVFLIALAVALLMHWPRVRHALAVLFFRLQHPRRHST